MRKNWAAGAVIGLVVALAAVVVIGGLFLAGMVFGFRVVGTAPPPVEMVISAPAQPAQIPTNQGQPNTPEDLVQGSAGESTEPTDLVHGSAGQSTEPTDIVQAPTGLPPEPTDLAQAPAGQPYVPVDLTQAQADLALAVSGISAHTSPAPSQPAPAAHPLADYQPIPVDPIEPLLPQQPIHLPAQWRELNQVIYEIAADYPGRISVVAVDLTTGSRYDFRSHDPYLPASTFKLPVTLCVLEEIAAGNLAWDTPVTYTQEDAEPVGAGGFATSPIGSQWSVRNLVDRSIISSNNVAVKMLARTLTWDGLLDCTTKIGGPVTRTKDGSTPVTASDEAAWWMHLWKTSQERPELAEELLRPLRQVTYYGRIQAGTPRPDLVTHKFGTYAGYDHDGAIVWADRPYVLVVMTHGSSEYQADLAIERIAAAAWRAVMENGE